MRSVQFVTRYDTNHVLIGVHGDMFLAEWTPDHDLRLITATRRPLVLDSTTDIVPVHIGDGKLLTSVFPHTTIYDKNHDRVEYDHVVWPEAWEHMNTVDSVVGLPVPVTACPGIILTINGMPVVWTLVVTCRIEHMTGHPLYFASFHDATFSVRAWVTYPILVDIPFPRFVLSDIRMRDKVIDFYGTVMPSMGPVAVTYNIPDFLSKVSHV
jgi:hypothetical protein